MGTKGWCGSVLCHGESVELLVETGVDVRGLNTIAQPDFAALPGAIGAAKYLRAVFHAVTNDFAPAMITFRRDHMDRTLEAVEDVRFSLEPDLERFVVVVSAMFAFGHKVCSFLTFRFVWVSSSLRTQS
jgi:hypothetical protein